MPYTASTVPKHVPKDKAAQWAAIFNSAMKEHDEETAFKMANAILSNKKDYISSVYSIDSRQVSQEVANYQPLGMSGQKGCANCNWYVPQDMGCIVVQGDIMPTGVSDFWLAKPEYTEKPIPVVIVPTIEDKSLVGKMKALLGMDDTEVRSPFTLYKSDGDLRFLCTPTNCYMDREYDILTSQAHKEFVALCNKAKQYPDLWLWHVKGAKCGSIDWLDYDDEGFICASGVIDKEWAPYVLKACEDGNIGMSHGFWPLAVDNDGFITKYVSFEYSILPVRNAANIWTAFNAQKGIEAMALSADAKKWLTGLGLPESQINDFEKQNKDTAEKLQAAGVMHKETTTEPPNPDPAPQPAPTPSGDITAQGFKALAEMLGEITKTVTAIGSEVAEIKQKQATIEAEVTKSIDDKIEETYKAKVATQPGGFIASQSKTNETTPEQNAAVVGPNGQGVSFLDSILDDSLKVMGGGIK